MANNSLNVPYVILSGTVLIGVIITLAIYQPMISESIELRNQIEENTTTLSDKQNNLRGIQNKVSALNAQREHENSLNVVLPQDDSLEDVLRIMHIAAQEAGGTISSIEDKSSNIQSAVSAQQLREENELNTPNITTLAFSLNFSGTYRELRVFLEKIEQSPRLMDVVDLAVEKSGSGEEISSSMTVQFYKYNLDELNT